MVWLDEHDRVLSSVKTYRPRLLLLGRPVRVTALGAVFTPQAYRRRGYASAMVHAVLAKARRRGDVAAILFTDIGTAYYEGLGFRPLPAEEQWGRLQATHDRGLEDWRLRPMREDDMEPVRLAHDAFCEGRTIAVLRGPAHWSFIRVRSESFFNRLGDPELTQRFRVAEREGRFAGYLITVEGRGDWNVREVGAVGGDVSWMAAILRLGAARAARAGLRRLYAWLPPSVVRELAPARWRSRPRRRAVPMIRPLEPGLNLSALHSPEASYLPFQDQF